MTSWNGYYGYMDTALHTARGGGGALLDTYDLQLNLFSILSKFSNPRSSCILSCDSWHHKSNDHMTSTWLAAFMFPKLLQTSTHKHTTPNGSQYISLAHWYTHDTLRRQHTSLPKIASIVTHYIGTLALWQDCNLLLNDIEILTFRKDDTMVTHLHKFHTPHHIRTIP